MPRRHVQLHARPPQEAQGEAVDVLVRRGLDDLRVELGVPAEFPAHVIAEAEAAAAGAPDGERSDATDIPFVTIDPEGSKDLDQAVHIERRDGGFRVRYAIADVAAWVSPGGALDDEARDRVETLYAPDGRTPLHPPLLSEGVASLLPDQVTPALLWTIDLDAEGAPVDVDVRRASVQSRAQLTYVGAQAALDDGTADETLQLLREVGILREAAERARGGITLPTPEQVVEQGADGVWTLGSRATLPVEEWNAQISLLTGMCAARLMLDGRIGIVRTLPDADPRDVERLRLSAHALGVPWPAGATPGDIIRDLDAGNPAHAALLTDATSLLRGAAYVAFDGEVPSFTMHAAIAAPYAHTTAPLRRLVDRFVGETCLALCADRPVPDWVRDALPELPGLMASGDKHAAEFERGSLDLVEAALLTGREGEVFDGAIVDVRADRDTGVVQLRDPAVRGRIEGASLPLGEDVQVRLTEASVAQRKVLFELAQADSASSSAPNLERR
ncbi:RNB domain-containing ribonuclease [Cellulomonas humilata]|uniref:Exoribonuclease R n=1 Tax=Cellulomonas humilata TaxID=144055 RepID=A0ABU0EAR7_9CELL|nr:RNB domain-containing ribonuclease [Cellulomonas humilata]MDQ0372359.1 exoribonuclease R [Cellulomonas humilata]